MNYILSIIILETTETPCFQMEFIERRIEILAKFILAEFYF
jgi:hypothetical protein